MFPIVMNSNVWMYNSLNNDIVLIEDINGQLYLFDTLTKTTTSILIILLSNQ